MKFVLAPDSFKGTLSATEVCAVMRDEVLRACPNAEVVAIPIADGGEGTVAAVLTAAGGRTVDVACTGPFGEAMRATYGVLPDETAIIELAACAGLPLVGAEANPELTTTYGVGELMAHAARGGARRIVLGLGGSATTDAGCGMAAALGVRFYDEAGQAFVPVGATLERVVRIDAAGLAALPPITVMCDVDNPLLGEAGAAAVFAPQKGADAAMVARLEAGLAHVADVCARDLGVDVQAIRGGGAAGGAGAGCVAFFGARLQSGIKTVLEITHFADALRGATAVFTGEGKIDAQSVHGKAVSGVAHASRAQGVPVIAVAGALGEGAEALYDEGVTAMFSTTPRPEPFAEAAAHAQENLARTMRNIMQVLRLQD